MTPEDPATAPPSATQPTPAAPAGGARVWPVFKAKREEIEPGRWRVYFSCAACRMTDIVDESLTLCRDCWRPAALLTRVLNEMRKEVP
jgi:hypothetical protein